MNDYLPHNQQAEEVVIAAIMNENRLMSKALAELEPDDFYLSLTKALFVGMAEMEAEGCPLDPISVCTHINQRGSMGRVTLFQENMPPVLNFPHYIRILKDATAHRRLIKGFDAFTSRARASDNVSELLSDVDQTLAEIRERCGMQAKGFRAFQEIGKDAMEQIDRLVSGYSNAVPTGFKPLDRATRGGIQPGDVWVIASLTGRGKSSWALGAARAQAMQGIPVGLVSREMSEFENFSRVWSAMSGVPMWKISPGLKSEDYEFLAQWNPIISDLPIFVNANTGNIFEIRSQVKEIVRTKGVRSLFIDYLQLLGVKYETKNSTTRAQEVATVSRVLKEIAMENKIGVFALAQFNRHANHDEQPEMHHLAESSGIEKDASLVLILDMEKPQERDQVRSCTMRIAKHRNGPLLSFAYSYHGSTLTFKEAA